MPRASGMAVLQWISAACPRVDPGVGRKEEPMRHFIVEYRTNKGKTCQVKVLAHDINEAATTFNYCHDLLDAAEILSIEMEPLLKLL